MSADSTPGGPDNDLDEQRPEHDSKNPALEDEPTADEVGGEGLGGDDELASGRIEPGMPQNGV